MQKVYINLLFFQTALPQILLLQQEQKSINHQPFLPETLLCRSWEMSPCDILS